ncbi:hypothetical protein BD309DRAFT_973226 [Dichomitus squalens]|nr:hypothetical protein BD309DRAFT_973226 [Dichomitus squalens]
MNRNRKHVYEVVISTKISRRLPIPPSGNRPPCETLRSTDGRPIPPQCQLALSQCTAITHNRSSPTPLSPFYPTPGC